VSISFEELWAKALDDEQSVFSPSGLERPRFPSIFPTPGAALRGTLPADALDSHFPLPTTTIATEFTGLPHTPERFSRGGRQMTCRYSLRME
jgi:hypothetical protein